MHRRNRPGWRHRALTAGLAITLLAAMTACQSTEEPKPVEPAPPQISAPLDDGGFQNLATNRALTPEEWARLMGYPDISDNAALEEARPSGNQLEGLEPVLDAGEQETPILNNEDAGPGIEEGDNDVLGFEPDEESDESGLPDGQRVIDETEEGVLVMPEDVLPDLGYEDGAVHLAGEEGMEAGGSQPDAPVIEPGEVHLIQEPEDIEEGDGISPDVISEMAAASANRPGEATIATFIRDNFAYVFLSAFGLLAILIFAAMSRFAASGDESSIRRGGKKTAKVRKEPQKAADEFDDKPLPSGKSFVFTEEKTDAAPTGGIMKDRMDDDSMDELELEPVDGVPDY